MAERRTRRRFTAEFKAEAVERLLEGGKGLIKVATEPGLSPGQLSGWRNEHLAAGSAEALALRKAEVQRLKRENKRLELCPRVASLADVTERSLSLAAAVAEPVGLWATRQ